VLRYRAMVHGISTPHLYGAGDKWNSYTSRYSPDWHCDLLEVLSDYGASSRVRLNEVCAVLGLPGKFGPSGADVAGMYYDGRLSSIRDYCETDVLNTYLVYLRHQLHTGGMERDSHNRAVADLVSMLESERGERSHLGDFLAAWHEAAQGKMLI
ncbi:MAG: 3'-5' exonuclease, partial [Rhodospirillales bacterium]